MARGSKQSNKTYFKVSYEKNANGVVDKDNGRPLFAEQKKEGDNWINASEDTFLEGYIIGISKSSYEYKNKPQYTFEILINGGEENYALQLNYGFFTRNILNSIATIEDLAATKLRLEIWRNKNGFVTVGVKNSTHNPDGDRTEWLLKQDALPKTDDPKWLPSFDYFIDIIEKRLEMSTGVPTDDSVNQLAEAMGAENPMEMEQEFTQRKAAETEKATQPTSETDKVDDLPF